MGLFDFAESAFGSVRNVVSETASYAGRAVSGTAFFAGNSVSHAGNAVCNAAEKGANLFSDTIDAIDKPASRALDFADGALGYLPEVIRHGSVGGLGMALAESVIDNLFRDKVAPVEGSVLYVDLACGYAEHSGIYVGGGEKCIVELTNQGGQCIINLVSPSEFINGGSGFSIYVSSHHGCAVGRKLAARTARSMVGRNLGRYSLVSNNCHMFTNYCLLQKDSDDYSRGISAIPDMKMTLTSIKNRARKVMNADEWRVWHYKD
ncbi:hypothetical protein [Succinimonas sp.]|uniref:hypothetical protein n=1 Tax=Succinimonas sp. TaxID=1936151 RepID=UPI00386BDAC6